LRPPAASRRGLAATALAALALALGACGDDEERAADTRTETTATTETAAPTATTGTPAPTTPVDTSPRTEALPGGQDGGATPPRQQDSPENDTPPPADSPAERFERECERNPEACG
jgi:hypothetical protein